MSVVVYRPSEKLVILKELELDYLVQDLATGRTWYIDKVYFRKKYEVAGTLIQNDIQ